MRISYQAISDVGRKRKGNEDHFLVNPDQRLFVVADGMGGHAAGEVASRIAVDAIDEFVSQHPRRRAAGPDVRRRGAASLPSPTASARRIVYSNGMVFDATRERSEYEGMATTVAAVLVEGAVAHLAHVGDSRVYLLRGAQHEADDPRPFLGQRAGRERHPHRRAGAHPSAAQRGDARAGRPRRPGGRRAASLEVRAGDILLLCSDGLTTMVTDDEIASILQVESGDLAETARRLVDAANESGGEDNVTVVLVQFQS